ncbi:UvrD-helicase domain-containing protein [Candidatus Poribacteria bacterium]|nr:UvrD-helicase domain-containing protein [Candidatus Poribacteria bacterium]
MDFTRNQRKAHDLNRHISVTAGAGSGKTAVLVHRYLKILLEKDLPPNQVVAITFTEKAAAELKQRVVNEVNARLQAEPHNTRLEEIKTGMLSAQISTIHAFCSRILREYPVEAGVDAGFRVLQGIQQRLILRETIDSTVREIANRPDEDETRKKLVELLRIFGKTRLERYLIELVNQREVVERLKCDLYCFTDSEVLAAWHNFVQSQLVESLTDLFPLGDWLRCLNRVLEIARGRAAATVRELVADIQPNMEPQEAVSRLRKIAPFIITQSGTISIRYFLGSGVETDTIEAEIDFLVPAAKHFRSFPAFTNDDELLDDKLLISVTRLLLDVYDEVQHAYAERKRQAGQLDFDDLQIKVRDLLQREETIREQLAKRYPYIMVDEYQDTDQLQYEILKPLISNFKSGNLFIVGDQNQSIYRFRGADVRVYDKTQQDLIEHQSALTEDFTWEGEILEAGDLEKRGDLRLPENFRLLRNLVGFVNLTFEEIMGGRNEFEVKYEPLVQGRTTNSLGDVELLIGSREEAEGESDAPTNENELIVARIRRLIGTAETVWTDEGDGEKPRPIRYSDIAILIRSRTRLPEIESALLEAEIPYKITGGIGFYQRQEIYDIGNYLQFLNDSKNDVALAGILRAPFFGVSDVELYEIAQQSSERSFWEKVQDYVAQTDRSSTFPISDAVEMLRSHLEICHRIPPSELIRKIVNDTGMVGVLSVGQSGEQRWANYEKFLGIARELEGSGVNDLHDFLERLNLLIEEEEREGQATTQLTADAVEIMTIHAAKGLEFPVVILPNLDRRVTRYDQEPFIDDRLGIGLSPANPDNNYTESDPGATRLMRERVTNKRVAEEQRLFYVATTRARDRLILSGTLTEKKEAREWLGWLFDALEISGLPSEEELLYPTTISVLSGEEETTIPFDLPIRIIKSPNELDFAEGKTATPPPLAEFPTYHIKPLTPSSASKIVSVAELTTYTHCPTRFYLQHRIQVPPSELQSEETAETIREASNRFLDSRVREIALNAGEVYRERHIHAEIGSHIVEGIADRFFKDSRGLWQVINYERDSINWEAIGTPADYYRSQIELYALLVHRLYPEQQVIPVTVYVTDLATTYSVEMMREELMDIESTWLERIEAIQEAVNADAIGVGRFEKHRDHCPSCPYFVDGECMVAD